MAQAGGQDARQPVDHDLQHRQALVGDEAGADDALHPRVAVAAVGLVVEAEEAVYLGLVQDAGGLPLHGIAPHREVVRRAAHWTRTWVNSTSVTRAGVAAREARPTSSSLKR